jgi:hypothetical protein
MQRPRLQRKASHRLGLCALVAVLGILVLFLLPLSIGPYSAVNGPATAFRSVEHAKAVRVAITSVILQAVIISLPLIPEPARIAINWSGEPVPSVLLAQHCVLLC